jgi:CRP-like cAMP-binding protein
MKFNHQAIVFGSGQRVLGQLQLPTRGRRPEACINRLKRQSWAWNPRQRVRGLYSNMREFSIGKIGGLEPSIPGNFAITLSEIGNEISLKKGDLIYRQGEEANCVFFLIKGRVKVTLIGSSGKEAILRIHLPHSILGLTSLASDPVRDANAICLDPASLLSIPLEDFERFMHRDPSFAMHIVRLLIDRMSDFHYRVGDWLTQSVEQRLSQALLALSAPDINNIPGETPEIPLTHEELAQIINTRRPTVSRILSKLADLNLVNQSGRTLQVADIERLTAYIERSRD